jgi:hypothetical protein
MNTTLFLRLFVFVAACAAAYADEVTDWNKILLKALVTPPAVAAPLAQRPAAIVQAAVFDAVNGIERRYAPVSVVPAAPAGASERAAAVQAAYASLVHLFPAQTSTFDQERTISLAAIANGPNADTSDAIQRGIDWGQAVSDAIWALRATDGFSITMPPFTGGTAVGQWQPTAAAFAPGLAPQMAHMTPWAILSPSQFRPAGPPKLTSREYTVDFNETKQTGSATSTARTDDETLYVKFWNSTSPAGFWDPVALALANDRKFTLAENARLLAHLNVGLADSLIGCWDAKYAYSSWRPITAIQQAANDGNPDTAPDPNWTPVITTPPFPEYPSAHSCASGTAATILSAYFGAHTPISMSSDGMPGVVRNFSNFSEAMEEVKNARVFGGIHFRSACNDGQGLGSAVGEYILRHALLPNERERGGEHHR